MTEDEIAMFMIAKETREHAYATRSEHKIGAAILTYDNVLFGGCNIESNISGLGSCAERVAINNAIAQGRYKIKALMLVDKDFIVPCGACLQYLCEFYLISGKDIRIYSATLDGRIRRYWFRKLLPHGFFSKDRSKIEAYK